MNKHSSVLALIALISVLSFKSLATTPAAYSGVPVTYDLCVNEDRLGFEEIKNLNNAKWTPLNSSNNRIVGQLVTVSPAVEALIEMLVNNQYRKLVEIRIVKKTGNLLQVHLLSNAWTRTQPEMLSIELSSIEKILANRGIKGLEIKREDGSQEVLCISQCKPQGGIVEFELPLAHRRALKMILNEGLNQNQIYTEGLKIDFTDISFISYGGNIKLYKITLPLEHGYKQTADGQKPFSVNPVIYITESEMNLYAKGFFKRLPAEKRVALLKDGISEISLTRFNVKEERALADKPIMYVPPTDVPLAPKQVITQPAPTTDSVLEPLYASLPPIMLRAPVDEKSPLEALLEADYTTPAPLPPRLQTQQPVIPPLLQIQQPVTPPTVQAKPVAPPTTSKNRNVTMHPTLLGFLAKSLKTINPFAQDSGISVQKEEDGTVIIRYMTGTNATPTSGKLYPVQVSLLQINDMLAKSGSNFSLKYNVEKNELLAVPAEKPIFAPFRSVKTEADQNNKTVTVSPLLRAQILEAQRYKGNPIKDYLVIKLGNKDEVFLEFKRAETKPGESELQVVSLDIFIPVFFGRYRSILQVDIKSRVISAVSMDSRQKLVVQKAALDPAQEATKPAAPIAKPQTTTAEKASPEQPKKEQGLALGRPVSIDSETAYKIIKKHNPTYQFGDKTSEVIAYQSTDTGEVLFQTYTNGLIYKTRLEKLGTILLNSEFGTGLFFDEKEMKIVPVEVQNSTIKAPTPSKTTASPKGKNSGQPSFEERNDLKVTPEGYLK